MGLLQKQNVNNGVKAIVRQGKINEESIMIRVFTLLSLLIISPYSFGQVNPWPWNALAPKTEISSNGIQAMAVKSGKDEVIVVVFGKKSSPAYEASLTEMPRLLPDIMATARIKAQFSALTLKRKMAGHLRLKL